MRERSTTLGLVALGAVAVLAGCGSSGPSKAEFAKKADALCAATNRAHPPKPNPKNVKAAAAIQAEEISIRTQLDKQLKALKAPGSEKSEIAAYNAGTQRIIAAITTMKNDALAGDEKKYTTDSQAFQAASAAREKIAIKLGFKTCGRRNPVQ